MIKTILFSFIFFISVNASAFNSSIFENYIWKLEKNDYWMYNSHYNIAYISKDDSILVVFKDHLNKYGLLYLNPEAKNKDHKTFFKIDNKEFKSYKNITFGSTIITDNTSSLVKSIREKSRVTVTTSLLYSIPTTFNLINSFETIGLLKPEHPNNALLSDIKINQDSMKDIVKRGIQLTKTIVGKDTGHPDGYILQLFEVDGNSVDIPIEMYPKIILEYKRKECEYNPYLWAGKISYYYSIKFKVTSMVVDHKVGHLCPIN
jgi:hypothetical protein